MLRLPAFTYHRPTTAAEAVAIHAEHGARARYVAGGTDLYPNMKRRHQSAAHLVSLARVAELRGVAADGAGVSIGAMTTLRAVDCLPFRRLWRAGGGAAREAGGDQQPGGDRTEPSQPAEHLFEHVGSQPAPPDPEIDIKRRAIRLRHQARQGGFEPPTNRLTADRSTAELLPNYRPLPAAQWVRESSRRAGSVKMNVSLVRPLSRPPYAPSTTRPRTQCGSIRGPPGAVRPRRADCLSGMQTRAVVGR